MLAGIQDQTLQVWLWPLCRTYPICNFRWSHHPYDSPFARPSTGNVAELVFRHSSRVPVSLRKWAQLHSNEDM